MKVNEHKLILVFILLLISLTSVLLFAASGALGVPLQDFSIQAEQLFRKNQTVQAKALISKYLAQKDNAEAYARVGSMYARLKNWKEAVHYLEIAQTRAPKNNSVLYRLGISYHQDGKIDDAAIQFRNALAIKPKNLFYVFALGELLEMADLNTDARQVYEEAVKLTGDNLELRSKLCLLDYKEAFWNEAISNCSKAIKKNPGDVTSWTLLAMSYYASEDRPRALAEFKKAVKIHPTSGILRRAHGYVFFQEKSYEQAVQELGIAFAVNPMDDEAALLLARSLYELGRIDDARIAYYLACLLNDTYRFEFVSKQRDLERKGKNDMSSRYEDTINKI